MSDGAAIGAGVRVARDAHVAPGAQVGGFWPVPREPDRSPQVAVW